MADYTHFDAGTFAKWLFTKIKGLLSGYVKTSDSRLSDARKASDVSAWAKASSKPTYTAAEVGAAAKDGANATGTWGISISGKAATADNANNVAWANTNHPATFPPSAHTHSMSQIADLGVFGGASATAAGSAGLVPQPAAGDQDKYLSAKGTWESITGKISGTKVTSANSADKLTAARTLTIGNTGKSFDGSANVSWSLSEIGAVGTFNRTDVGSAPNFDDPGVNGLFEVRKSIETPNETGTKPFNVHGPLLSIKTRDNIAMLQIAGTEGQYFIRGHQAANVTMKNVPWKRIALFSDIPTSLPASDVSAWAKASSKPSYSWGEITGKPSTFPPSTHTHTKSQITDFPSSLKNPNALSITANGTTVKYDGSSAQSISISSGGSKSVASTLLASGWQGSAAPYTYDIGSAYSGKSVVIGYDATKYTESSAEAVGDADIVGGEGTIIYAYGEKPSVDIPIIIQYS